MIIQSVEVFRYALPLTPLVLIRNTPISIREGLIVKLSAPEGRAGYGEIAPLPGLHRETLNDVIREVNSEGRGLFSLKFSSRRLRLEGEFQDWLPKTFRYPSTRFGIEMAVFNLLAAVHDVPLYTLFFPGPPQDIPHHIRLNGLLTRETGDIAASARQLVGEGYRTIKMKVGGGEISEDIRRVGELREAVGEKIDLRLDANQAWSLPEAVRFGKAVRNFKLEYIEEPLQDPAGMESFYQECGVPVALDESLIGPDPEKFKWVSAIKAMVVKPARLGGMLPVLKLIGSGYHSGVYPVFSSLYESGLGLSYLAQMALAASREPGRVAMGLDTYRWLGEDLLRTPFRAEGGKIDLKKIARRSGHLRRQRLTPLFKLDR